MGEKDIKRSTGLAALDKVLRGGIAISKPVAVYGDTAIGKSTLCMQLAFWFSRFGKVLYFDTEAFLDDETWDFYEEQFCNRWKDAKPENIEVILVTSAFEYARYWGMDIKVEQSEKKTTAQVMFPKRIQGDRVVKKSEMDISWLKYSWVWKKVSSVKDYQIIIVDSLSMMLKDLISSQTQNLPARATIVQKLLAAGRELSRALKIPVLTTHHASINPQDPRDLGKPYGGKDIFYYNKQIVGIIHPTKELNEKYNPNKSDDIYVKRLVRARSTPPGKRIIVPVILKWGVGFIDVE